MLALAALGAVLPGLPTTPLVLLAAACFSRGSKRWHRWLREHPTFGALVRDWEEHGAIGSRAKRAAIAMIIVVGGVSAFLLPGWEWRVALAAFLLAVVYYLATRPGPPREVADSPLLSEMNEGPTWRDPRSKL